MQHQTRLSKLMRLSLERQNRKGYLLKQKHKRRRTIRSLALETALVNYSK